MSSLNRFLFLLAFSVLSVSVQGQYDALQLTLIQKAKDYAAIDSLTQQLETLNAFYKLFEIKEEKYAATLDIYPSIPPCRNPQSSAENTLIRQYYAKLFYADQKINGDLLADKNLINQAMAFNNPIGEDKYIWNIENKMGSLYARLNDYDQTLYYYNLAEPHLLAKKNNTRIAQFYAQKAQTYLWIQDSTNADLAFEKGLIHANKSSHPKGKLAVYQRIRERAIEEEDHEAFIKYSNLTKTLLAKNEKGEQNISRRAAYMADMGRYYQQKQQFDSSFVYFQKARNYQLEADKSTNIKRDVAKLDRQFAEAYLKANKLQHCRDQLVKGFAEILPMSQIVKKGIFDKNFLYAENTLVDLYLTLAQLYSKQYTETEQVIFLDSMQLSLELATYVNEMLNDQMIFSQSKNLHSAETRMIINSQIECSYQRYQHSNDDQLIAEIRTIFDKSKDLILTQKLNMNRMIDALSDQQKEQYHTYRKAFSNNTKQLATAKIKATRDSLKHVLFSIKRDMVSMIDLDRKLITTKTQKRNTLEYLMTDQYIYLLSNLDGKTNFYRLQERSSVVQLISRFNKLMQTESIRGTVAFNDHESSQKELSLTEVLAQLHDLLVPQDLTLPSEFVVIPDDVLSSFPFDLLRRDDQYLLNEHTVYYDTHFRTQYFDSKKKNQEILCLAPQYKQKQSFAEARISRTGFGHLPAAITEVEHILSLFPNRVTSINPDVAVDLEEQLSEARIFHFAGHAKAKHDSSFLLLQTANGYRKLTQDEIYMSRIDVDLVTLSACESGLGTFRSGDGVSSLARSFKAAGARTVINSLWLADDASTSKIMANLYDNIKDGESTAEALRHAKLAFLDQAQPELRHPYYWSGFIVTGANHAIFPKADFTKQFIYAAGLLGLLLLSLYIYKITKK